MRSGGRGSLLDRLVSSQSTCTVNGRGGSIKRALSHADTMKPFVYNALPARVLFGTGLSK